MYAHERSLVQQLADKPFALIGVNSDKDREKIKQTVKDKNLNWRSFWNFADEENPISNAWEVEGWPTVFLIDADGVIRAKWTGNPKEIDPSITELLAELGTDVTIQAEH